MRTIGAHFRQTDGRPGPDAYTLSDAYVSFVNEYGSYRERMVEDATNMALILAEAERTLSEQELDRLRRELRIETMDQRNLAYRTALRFKAFDPVAALPIRNALRLWAHRIVRCQSPVA